MDEKDPIRTLIFLSLQYVQASVIPVVESLFCLLVLRGCDGTPGEPMLSDRLGSALMLPEAALGELSSQIFSTGDGRGIWSSSSSFDSSLPDYGAKYGLSSW